MWNDGRIEFVTTGGRACNSLTRVNRSKFARRNCHTGGYSLVGISQGGLRDPCEQILLTANKC
jgi:hypothetical protein